MTGACWRAHWLKTLTVIACGAPGHFQLTPPSTTVGASTTRRAVEVLPASTLLVVKALKRSSSRSTRTCHEPGWSSSKRTRPAPSLTARRRAARRRTSTVTPASGLPAASTTSPSSVPLRPSARSSFVSPATCSPLSSSELRVPASAMTSYTPVISGSTKRPASSLSARATSPPPPWGVTMTAACATPASAASTRPLSRDDACSTMTPARVVAPGSYWLGVANEAETCGDSAGDAQLELKAGETRQLDLVARPHVRDLEVQVLDPSGQPVHEAMVTFVDATTLSTMLDIVFTDEKGLTRHGTSFREGPASGPVQVLAVKGTRSGKSAPFRMGGARRVTVTLDLCWITTRTRSFSRR